MAYLDGKRANKGEWAELYVFLKLLGEGKLYAADQHLKRKPGYYVEVLKVLREEVVGEISEYRRDGAMVDIVVAGARVASVPAKDFLDNASRFFVYLERAGGKGSIAVTDEIAEFSHVIMVSKAKSPSLRNLADFGGKSDIVLETRDGRSGVVSTMGFSIKSQFGSPPTLYNAGASTQFEYELHGMDDAGMLEFNSVDQRVRHKSWTATSALFRSRGWTAEYTGTPNANTSNNFFLIRDSMPELMAWIYRRALLEDYPRSLSFPALQVALERENPLHYPNTSVYEKAIKDFLFASFSGMTGGVAWDGTEQVNGGYIVVMPSGEVLCYHANDREVFREYLYRQTRIEYVSKSKYRWGTVQKTPDGRYTLLLNGSVRFYPHFQ